MNWHRIIRKCDNIKGAIRLKKQVSILKSGRHTQAKVRSQSDTATQYQVSINFQTNRCSCTCPHAKNRKVICKHIAAVAMHQLHTQTVLDEGVDPDLTYNNERMVRVKDCPKGWTSFDVVVIAATLKSVKVCFDDGFCCFLPKSMLVYTKAQGRALTVCTDAQWLRQTKREAA